MDSELQENHVTKRTLAYIEKPTDLDVRIEAHQRYSSLRMEAVLQDWLQATPTMRRICDLGCGSGNYSELFSHRCSLYVGLDANESLLDQAYRKCSRLGLENTLFMQWNMNDRFPVVPGSFDFLFSAFSAYYVDDAEKLIKDCKDMLARNGEIWFVGPVPGNAVELDRLSEELFGVPSSSEKDIRLARLQNEFAPLMNTIFGNCKAVDRDFSLNFPSSSEYARYYKATPQYLELAEKHGHPENDFIENVIRTLTALKLTKKSTFLSATKL